MRRIFLLLCIVFCGVAKGQVANFTSDVSKGCAPLVVHNFTSLSSGNPVKYFWDFGNGNTSTQPSPGTIYFNPGSYSVKLVVEDAAGRKDSVIKANFINVSKIPDVNFAVVSTSGCIPYNVQFTDQTVSNSGTINKWEWDFGDGTTSSEKSPAHTFTFGGDFSITLKATDETGCGAVQSKTSYIHVNPTFKAAFTSTSAATCRPPIAISFTNTSTGGTVTNSLWDFGDGSTSTALNPSHNYTRSGTFPVKLTTTNQYGCVDTITQPVVIGTIVSGFTLPAGICQDVPVSFVNTTLPANSSSKWDFGDNTSSVDASPVKTYTAAGAYVVKLVSTLGDCKDSVTKNITVVAKPAADFSFVAPGAACKLPLDVNFTSKATGATSYFWDFGDGTTGTNQNPNHSYKNFGSYTVKLVVSNANNCADSVVKSNLITVASAKINGFNGLPSGSCVTVQQNFSANITSPEPVTSYLWDFGDGATSTSATPNHLYAKEGTYNVSLQIKTASGCTDALALPGAITLASRPTAGFSGAPRIACSSETVKFTDLSKGTIDTRTWTFGDGGTATTANSEHRYLDTGFFTVSLIVGNAGCNDTATVKDYIYINPPVAKFSLQYDCNDPLKRSFQNKSVVAQTAKWEFGDGTGSTDLNPTHTYASGGTYIVKLHVTNGSCVDDYSETIKVIDERPQFTVSQTEICKNNTNVFTVTKVNPDNIASYSWNFGDNTPVVTVGTPVVNYNYPGTGIFSPTLVVEDKVGCTRTITNAVSIAVYGPKAGFENPAGACASGTILFTDRSTPTGNHPINKWIMDYGDGKADSVNTPGFSHVYTAPNAYNVSLIVTDSYGCRDTLTKANAITITNSKAAFSLKDSVFCNNSSVNFTDSSKGDNLTYAWNFGDGSAANTASATHTYSAEGSYNVSLLIKDPFGCADSISKSKAVTIGNVKASFSIDDSVISCPPAQINFANKSLYAASVKWVFDDGGFSTIASPTHYFSTARTYHVKLIANGYGACVDSTVKDIVVKGPRGSFTYTPVFRCAPADIKFTEDASDYNKSFNWDFGDGTTTTNSAASISHVYKEPGKYFPKLFLEDTTLNCRVAIFGTDTITVSSAESRISIPRNTFCDSAGVQFFDSSRLQYDTITSYQWTFGDGTVSASPTPIHNYVSTGLFPVTLTIKTKGGCTDTSDSSFVKIVKSPQVLVTGPTEVCLNQPVTFSGTVQADTSAIKWSWDFRNESTYSVAAPPPQTYNVAGTYLINASVTNSSGCVKTDTANLTVHPLPNLSAGLDTAICRGSSMTLQPTGAISYVWSSNQTLSCTTCANPVISPVDTSVYYFVTGTGAIGGCKNTDTINVKVVQPFRIVGMNPDTLCLGESVQLKITGADNYSWSPANGLNNTNIADPVAKPTATTTYTVVGHDYKNCFADTGYVPIAVYPIPVFNIVDDNISLPAGNSVKINTTSSADITRWEWFPVSGLSCIDCAEPVTSATNTITYKATAINGGGCRAEDKITVQVFCNNGNVFIPNTFSPNNDGSNDLFYPRGKGISGIRNLQIFNRAGVIVFQKANFTINDPRAGWDGTYNGKPVDSGVYVYQVDVICETGQVFPMKGDITLIR